MRKRIILACEQCKQRNYATMKNKLKDHDRIKLKKFCKHCQTTTAHRETK